MTRPPRTKQCEQCGATFSKRPTESLARWQGHRFCSHACFSDHRRKPMPIRQCEWCGRDFQTDVTNQRTCSTSCGTKLTGAARFAEDRVHIISGRTVERVLNHDTGAMSILVDSVEVACGNRESMYMVQKAVERTIERLEGVA